MPFDCSVVTPEQPVLQTKARQVIVPAHDGLAGVLTDRAPVLVKLGAGILRIDKTDDTSVAYRISGGVAQMKDNKLTILTDQASPLEPAARQ